MKDYKTVLFDLYGTLVDIHTDEEMPRFWKTVRDFYESHGASYTAAELQKEYLRLVAEEEDALRASGGGDSHESHPEIELAKVFVRLYKNRGVKYVTDELITETAACFRAASTTHLRLYAGAAELLQALHSAGKRVILLSNAQSLFTIPELKSLGILDLFDRIFISSDYNCKKPDAEFFLAPVRELSLDPADCLMIGNDPTCDIKGAMAIGMDAYFIHSGLSPKPCPKRISLGLAPERYQKGMDLKLVKRHLGV